MKIIKLACVFVSLLYVTDSLASHFVHGDIRGWVDQYINDAQKFLRNPSLPFERRKEYFDALVVYLQTDEISQHCPGFDQQIKKQTLQKMDETAFAISTIALENIPNILAQVESCLKETAAAAAHKPGPHGENTLIAQQAAVDTALKKLNDVCMAEADLKGIQKYAGPGTPANIYTHILKKALDASKEIVTILAAQNLIDAEQFNVESRQKRIEEAQASKTAGTFEKIRALTNGVSDLRLELIHGIFKKIDVPGLKINIPEECEPKFDFS